MSFWDFDRDGIMDATEKMFLAESLCASREEHIALFGYAGEWGEEEIDEEEELEDELLMVGLDRFELEFMDEDERREALEDAGLDPDDFDDF